MNTRYFNNGTVHGFTIKGEDYVMKFTYEHGGNVEPGSGNSMKDFMHEMVGYVEGFVKVTGEEYDI